MKLIEKLTAEHLAIYFPHRLEYIDTEGGFTGIRKLCFKTIEWVLKQGKIILRTLQSITPEELETFSICFRMWYDKPSFDYNLMVYSDVVQMAKLHIDIFGLIENGLAVDKETIKK